MNKKKNTLKRAFLAAFPHTIPIFAGFWFLGLTYGIYMNVSGFSFLYPMLMSLTIFAGSIEFVTVGMLLGPFNPLQALVMTLMINARHLFYGISMLDKFKGTGRKKLYLIYGYVRRKLLYQLHCQRSKGCGLWMVYVLRHIVESSVLVHWFHTRRYLWLHNTF